MKIVVTGSRGWVDEATIRRVLLRYKEAADAAGEELLVIHGHAKSGADKVADKVCSDLGIERAREPAEWNRYKQGAGPIRNQKMIDKYHPDLVLAFRAGGRSRGTDDMIDRGVKAKIPTIVRHEGDPQSYLARVPGASPAGEGLFGD